MLQRIPFAPSLSPKAVFGRFRYLQAGIRRQFAISAGASHYTIETKPGRNLFGPGCIKRLPAELEQLRVSRVLLVGSGSERSIAQLSTVAAFIGPLWCDTWPGATNYILPEKVDEVEERCRVTEADCVLSVGGGGPVGYGKMLAFRRRIPLVTVVTTYSGSETTAQQSMIEVGGKKQYKDSSMMARLRIYDPDLSAELPVSFSVVSGINALAHAVSKLCNPAANRFEILHAEEAIRVMVSALRRIKEGTQPAAEARADALYGAWLCGSLIGTTTIQYKLAHVLGGTFKTPHAETHTVSLPHSIAFNESVAPMVGQRLRGALGASDGKSSAQAMQDLIIQLGAPSSLKELGFEEENLGRAVDLVMDGAQTHTTNYGSYERKAVESILHNMHHGNCP